MTGAVRIAAGLGLAALIALPLWGSDYALLFFLLFFLYAALAQMWNLLAGFAGLISLGQQAFIGLGGYALAVLIDRYDCGVWIGVLFGGLLSLVLATGLIPVLFRMKGLYFAIGAWIAAEILKLLFGGWSFVGYGAGLFVNPANPPSMTALYYAALIAGTGATLFAWRLLRSPIGLGLTAIRDNEIAAEALGVNPLRLKILCWLAAAAITGAVGGLFALFQVFIQPYQAFSIDWTVIVVFIVIIGGMGTLEGPILGALIYVTLSQTLADYGRVSMLVFGLTAVAVILAAPQGLAGTARAKTGFELFPIHRTNRK